MRVMRGDRRRVVWGRGQDHGALLVGGGDAVLAVLIPVRVVLAEAEALGCRFEDAGVAAKDGRDARERFEVIDSDVEEEGELLLVDEGSGDVVGVGGL